MSEPSPSRPQWQARRYETKHTQFPYTAEDLTPMDSSPDSEFYSSPRFVTHIDDHAIAVLRSYYTTVLPASKQDTTDGQTPQILDLCSSWVSHYPRSIEDAVKAGDALVAGIGMNAAELAANPLFGQSVNNRYLVRDLNQNPEIPAFGAINTDPSSESDTSEGGTEGLVDATTLTVSIDYLTSPEPLLRSLLKRSKAGATLHVAVSNRCFPTKAVRRWLSLSEDDRLAMVAELLVWSGWEEVEILCLCNGRLSEEEMKAMGEQGGSADRAGMVERIISGLGMAVQSGRVDPLWIVRGRKPASK